MRLHFGHDLPGVTPRAAARITAASTIAFAGQGGEQPPPGFRRGSAIPLAHGKFDPSKIEPVCRLRD
jgi:hypothetical protein